MPLLEKIYELRPNQSELLYSECVNGQLIEVREFEHYRWVQIGGSSIHSLMDVSSPSQIMLPNAKAMMTALLFCPKPQQLLNMGFGGGLFERFFATNFPELKITSLESNETVIRLSKEFFFIAEEHPVINDSAEHFLSKEQTSFDIILCDIFSAEKHPDCLYEEIFYINASHCLNRTGVFALNLIPTSEEDVVTIVIAMRNSFNHISLLEVPGHANVIIFASQCNLLDRVNLEIEIYSLFKRTRLDLTDVPQRLIRLLGNL